MLNDTMTAGQLRALEEMKAAQGISSREPGPLLGSGRGRVVFWTLALFGVLFPPVWLICWWMVHDQRKFTAMFDPEHPFVPSPTGWRPNPAYVGPAVAPPSGAGVIPGTPGPPGGPEPTLSSTDPAANPAASPATGGVADRLAALEALHANGQVSAEEYADQRARILTGL